MNLIEGNKAAAWRVYLGCGGNLVKTARLLKAQGIALSEDVIGRWAIDENWQARMAKADMVALASALPVTQELLIAGLAERLATWNAYFATNPGDVDPMATAAYVQLVKLALKCVPKSKTPAIDALKRQAATQAILEAEYGIGR